MSPETCGPMKRTKAQIAEDRRWKARSDLEALSRAKEIMEDEDRLAAVREIIEEGSEVIDTLSVGLRGLRDYKK